MSASSCVITRPGNQIFDRLPDDAVRSVFQFLKEVNGSISISSAEDDQTKLVVGYVCKNWQNNPIIKKEQREAATRLHQRAALKNVHHQMIERDYPPSLLELLQSHNLSIPELPVLDVKVSDALDAPMSRANDLTHRIMRFKTEDNRPGLAFHLQRLDKRIVRLAGQEILFPGESSVLHIYKQSPNPQNQSWRYAWVQKTIQLGRYKRDQNGVKAHLSHLFNQSLYPVEIDHAFLFQVITNKNRSYRIFSEEEPPPHPIRLLADTLCNRFFILSAQTLAIGALYSKIQKG